MCLLSFKLEPTLPEPEKSPATELLFPRSTGSWKCSVLYLENTISEQKSLHDHSKIFKRKKIPLSQNLRTRGKRERHAYQAGSMFTKSMLTLNFNKYNYVLCYCCETPTEGWLCLAGLLQQPGCNRQSWRSSPWCEGGPTGKTHPLNRSEHIDQLRWPRSCHNVTSWYTMLGMQKFETTDG